MPFLRALRSLTRRPSASLLAIGAMTVGIGLAAAMLAVLNGTIWNPLPFPDASRLVAVQGPVTAATVDDWERSSRSFDAIAGYRSRRYTLSGVGGDAVSVRATVATGAFFSVLRAPAALGRVLRPSDARSAGLVVVLSDDCWRTTFHGDGAVIGRSIVLSGTSFVVVGVMPSAFVFPVDAERVDVYTTTAADLLTDRRPAGGGHPRDLLVVASLKPGITVPQARAEMEAIRASDEPDATRRAARRATLVVPLADDVAAGVVSPVTTLGWVALGVVLMACATTTILSLIGVTTRRGEWATRLALGATSGRLARQVLAEGLVVSLVGGAFGALLAVSWSRPLLLLAGPAVSAAARARFDASVWGLILLVIVVAGALFSVIPAVQAGATPWIAPSMSARGRGRSGSTARGLLVMAETALAVVLLSACVSLLRAFVVLSSASTGFQPDGVTTFRVDLSDSLSSPAQQVEFFETTRERAAGVPAVEAAAFTALPPFGDLKFTIRLAAPGDAGQQRSGGAEVNLVSPAYFRTMRIPILRGREFTSDDTAGRQPVVIISRALASRLFAGGDPIGREIDVRLGRNASGPLPTVVGMVGDVRTGTLATPGDPQLYVPYAQAPMLPSATFVVRVPDERATAAMSRLGQMLRRADPTIAIVNVKPLGDAVRGSVSLPRFATALAAILASIALFLAMAGVYAVATFAAFGRRHEFSIRRALGASESRITRLVVSQSFRWLLPGLALGGVGSAAVERGLEGAMYGVHPNPASTIGLTLLVAGVLSLAAAWWPAHRAGRDQLRAQLQSTP